MMIGYIINFTVYTLAMIGVISIALIITKKTSLNYLRGKQNQCIKIEDTLNITPRKTLYIIEVKDEKFLIASDLDRTTYLAKLENNNKNQSINIPLKNDTLDKKSEKTSEKENKKTEILSNIDNFITHEIENNNEISHFDKFITTFDSQECKKARISVFRQILAKI